MVGHAGQEELSAQKTCFFPVRSDVSAGEGVLELSSIKLIVFVLYTLISVLIKSLQGPSGWTLANYQRFVRTQP